MKNYYILFDNKLDEPTICYSSNSFAEINKIYKYLSKNKSRLTYANATFKIITKNNRFEKIRTKIGDVER